MDRTAARPRGVSAFQVAGTYVGTVVGAGFASGQEVLQFFGYHGPFGLVALALAGGLFVFFGGRVMQLGRETGARSHLEVIRLAGGRWIGRLVDWVVIFFLFGALTAMAAGAGAIFTEQFGWPAFLGNAAMIVISIITVLLGINGVITAISSVAPILVGSVLLMSIVTLASAPAGLAGLSWSSPGRAAVPTWPLSALVYVSYNLVLSVAVLAPLGAQASGRTVLRRGAILGGLGLGVGAAAIQAALLVTAPRSTGFAVPMIFIASRFSPWVQLAYSAVLFAEVYTTAVGNLFGFAARLTRTPGAFRRVVLLAGAAAFAASLIGFTSLVRVLYPAVGYAGLFLLGGLLWQWFRTVASLRMTRMT